MSRPFIKGEQVRVTVSWLVSRQTFPVEYDIYFPAGSIGVVVGDETADSNPSVFVRGYGVATVPPARLRRGCYAWKDEHEAE